jgi:non-specific serine/threonine protein kinase
MTQDIAAQYRFGRFVVQPRERRLLVDGQPVTAGPRAFDVLMALIERGGQLVTKDELLERVWPKLIVEENNLQVQVSALRKILGQEAIATIPGRGYRFTPEIVSASESSSLPALRRHNLPQQLTSFIGHEEDLDDYAALLDQTRLFTLTGIGGCGKSRLAIKLAERVLSLFPDGVWYVDLAPLLDAERVPLTVATTLGVSEGSDRSIVDVLCEHLAHQRALLVLDNCEHLTVACATLAQQVISSTPDVRVLAASREGLGVRGERTVTVRSLSFPPPGSRRDLAALEACEAVRLFVERARLSVPKFALAFDTGDAIAEVCRRLDGIPLAIELAAARVKVLSVEEIRARLDDRFRLLTGGSKTALGRQQTLLATIQWSYGHLAPDEQQLLRRLSVFVGGWTLEGAARVYEEPDPYVVLDRLARLIDHSLVMTHHVENGASRYSMLETVRQYAHEQLVDAGESDAARNRHLEFYLDLAEEADPELVGPVQGSWLARLEPELENFLAAHTWCDHARDRAQLGLRLVSALKTYFRQKLLMTLGYRVTMEALARPGAQGRNFARCRALWDAGEHGYFTGRYGETRTLVESSLAIAREIRNEGRIAEALRLLGYAALAQGDQGMARRHFDEALALSRRLGDKRQLSSALCGRAVLHVAQGEPDRAEPLHEEALALSRECGDSSSIAIELANLASISISLGSESRAREMVREGLAIAEEIGSSRTGHVHLSNATGLAAFLGEWTFAARLHGATNALSEQMGYRREPEDQATYAPVIARTREALGSTAFAAAEISGRSLSYDEAIAEARAWLEQRA